MMTRRTTMTRQAMMTRQVTPRTRAVLRFAAIVACTTAFVTLAQEDSEPGTAIPTVHVVVPSDASDGSNH
ncbi:hypothetical protein [Gordonia sp. NPDC127522]|uniref:hypothetical protein n=1 Tax=Gordonia sp. NPDC127522 TaxID=3345390 RepID=UPI0036452FD1